MTISVRLDETTAARLCLLDEQGERRGIAAVATLDQHFDIYRTADRKRLHNVFFRGRRA